MSKVEKFKKKALANKTKFDKIFELKKEFFSEVSELNLKVIYENGFIDDMFSLSLIAFAEAYYKSRINNSKYVVELSDNEIKILSESELVKWKKVALEFDGFEGWIVRGKLIEQ